MPNIYSVAGIVQHHAKEKSTDFTDLTRRYKAIMKSKRFHTAFPNYKPRKITLEKGSGGGSYAHFYSYSGPLKNRSWLISLGTNRNEYVMLHEIAHHVARLHSQYGNCSDHGPGFASAFLDVVRVVLGAEAERSMKYAYKAFRLKVYSPTKPNGVNVRVRGEAPESVKEMIDKILGHKKKNATERAIARQAVKQVERLPKGWTEEVTGTDCPACGGQYTVRASGWTRTTEKFWVRCDSQECGLSELVVMPRTFGARVAAG
jgi:hypothetical protein